MATCSLDPLCTSYSHTLTTSESKKNNFNGYVLVALGTIVLIGSLIACGFLYAQVGSWSLAVAGIGLVVGLGLIAFGLCGSKSSSLPPIKEQAPIVEKAVPLRSKKSSRKHKPKVVDAPVAGLPKTENKAGSIDLILRPQVPVRASDIDLPQTLPDYIPAACDIRGDEWLTNDHLRLYFPYLAKKFPNIVLIDFGNALRPPFEKFNIEFLKELIFNYLPGQIDNFSDLDIPFPLCVSNNHWTLVYIDRVKRTVEYYDSKQCYGNHTGIVKQLTAIAEKLSYRFESKINKVLQPDSYQCGPWMLYFLEYRLINPDFNFNQLDVDEAQHLIAKYRIKIMLTMVEVDAVISPLQSKELGAYSHFYENKHEARKMLAADQAKVPTRERWMQILENRPLVPGKNIS